MRPFLDGSRRTRAAWGAAGGVLLGLLLGVRAPGATPLDGDAQVGGFVEPGFPFISSTVDARALGPGFAPRNVATRGLVLMLGNGAYATFDPDLLRLAVGWHGDFMSLTTMAQISYGEALNKNNAVPRVLGTPIVATGIYPGWTAGAPDFRDPRPAGPYPEDVGRGPIAPELGRWNGLYTVGDRAVLSYTVRGTDVYEQVGSVRAGEEVGITRTFHTGAFSQPLTLVVAEVGNGSAAKVEGGTARITQPGDTVTVAAVTGLKGARLQVTENRYITLEIPAGTPASLFRVVTWRGPESARKAVAQMQKQRVQMVDFAKGGPAHWPGTVATRGVVAPDSAAYVVDRITLPTDNPWKRNVRVADVAFFRDGRAAVVTFEGDVWTVSGVDRGLEKMEWKRFASGLYEPLSLAVVDDQVYVYSRDGVVRPRDLNGDGEADYYENFSNLLVQSIESREFPLSMDEKPGGGFILSKGGALDNGPKTAPQIAPGFRAGSAQSGTVMELSADGRTLRPFATGLREPFIGVNPRTGAVASSDQQGNFVPSTPVYLLERGGYYGVKPTAHRDSLPEEPQALVWLPHEVDQSGAGEVWVTGDRMGFGGDALVHISYGRPGAFRVYVDSIANGVQGAAVSLLGADFQAPLLKGEVNPHDGQLYLAGFQIWGSKAAPDQVATLVRLRYTGRPSPLPLSVRSGRQGVLLRFAAPLDPAAATDAASYDVQRWNYQRTEKYGSGHFKLDGSPGQDRLAVAAAHLSPDRRGLLLVIPDMREVMQLQLAYALRGADGRAVADTAWLTVNSVDELDLAAAGFGAVDWRAEMQRVTSAPAPAAPAVAASARLGAQVYQRSACVGCHSVDGSTAGKLGPTLKGLAGSLVTFSDGTTARADAAYLRESILDPGRHIVKGYEEGMPSFRGILSDAEVESLVLYIQSLGGAGR